MTTTQQTLEVPICGMDCAECAGHVQRAIAALPGVASVDVLLAAEKAVVRLDPAQATMAAIQQAVEGAGYSVAAAQPQAATDAQALASGYTRALLSLFGLVFGAILLIVVAGEWLGLFETLTEQVPFAVGMLLVLLAGYPVFRNVLQATLRRQVTAHTLMTIGVIAALAVGQWTTAAIVVFFMRIGDYTERFTAERARRAVRDLTALAPRTARVERDGTEVEVQVAEVRVGEVVVVRPGEQIPVDGEVLSGQATVDQATITGESLPVEAGPGSSVFAATFARLGSLRIRTTHTGADTTFGKVIRLVEEAETHRSDAQRFADRFASYYLPVVAGVALLTFILRQDPLATAAVLVVACACAIAMATPIAMLASVGAAARRGMLIKGGKYLELLARADVLLLDKTGTLTMGRPQITDVVPFGSLPEHEILALAAAAERYSEHPLAEAVRRAAHERGIALREAAQFESLPGLGIRARIGEHEIMVGSRRMIAEHSKQQVASTVHALPTAINPAPRDEPAHNLHSSLFTQVAAHSLPTAIDPAPRDEPANTLHSSLFTLQWLESEGKTLLFVACDGEPIGVLAASDTPREEVPQALARARALGIKQIEILTGDNERVAAAMAERLGVSHRAGLLPEDKIAVVREYQTRGHTVVMVGDGVNDAPALAQADIGIAMGVAGSDIAIEAAHIALLRDDWLLVPEVLRIAQRTMNVVRMNLGLTAAYNLVGLSLAALGIIPPVVAAAAQSLPDIGILMNSSRLLRG